jgi:thiosulfate reductase cytochrome b subunit
MNCAALPKLGFFGMIGRFLCNWASECTVLILTFASIAVATELIYLITNRAVHETYGWLLDYSSRCVVIALAITFVSVAREAFGSWYTSAQLLNRPLLAAIQAAKSLAMLLAFLWVLSH